MTLRLHYYLMLLSLFAGFALANAALYFFVVRSELAWGISEQSQGRAICLASFIGRELRPESPAFAATMSAGLTRLSANARGLNVQWFEETAAGWKSIPLFDSAGIAAPEKPTVDQLRQLRKGEACSRLLSLPNGDADLCFGYAAVLDKNGGPRAFLAVSSKDTILRNESRDALRQCMWYCLIVAFLGLLVAETLTQIAKRGIFRLEEGADALAKGDYSYGWHSNRITELNDLSNTFKTISQILQEDIRQAWRRFFQAELLPRQEEIATDCLVFCDTASRESEFGPQLAIRRLNGASLDDFWGLRSDSKGWQLVVGRLEPQAQSSDMLSQIVRANSARDYFLGCASSVPPSEVWEKMNRVFLCLQIEFNRAASGSDAVSRYSWSARAPHFEELALGRKRGVLGTLNDDALRFASDYVTQYSDQPIELIADKLTMILAPNNQGILVLYEWKLRT